MQAAYLSPGCFYASRKLFDAKLAALNWITPRTDGLRCFTEIYTCDCTAWYVLQLVHQWPQTDPPAGMQLTLMPIILRQDIGQQ